MGFTNDYDYDCTKIQRRLQQQQLNIERPGLRVLWIRVDENVAKQLPDILYQTKSTLEELHLIFDSDEETKSALRLFSDKNLQNSDRWNTFKTWTLPLFSNMIALTTLYCSAQFLRHHQNVINAIIQKSLALEHITLDYYHNEKVNQNTAAGVIDLSRLRRLEIRGSLSEYEDKQRPLILFFENHGLQGKSSSLYVLFFMGSVITE